jgi:tRNA threonylcarbamoyladenosine biosynthesis protein TsaE
MHKFERLYTTNSAKNTRLLGKEMGKRLVPGSVILLSGDLGSGKTVFVQGLASGLDVSPEYYITSPTYTLINEYPARFPFFHADLFRLKESAALEDIGLIEHFSSPNVVAIEWPEKIHRSELPTDYCQIEFNAKNDFIRTIHIIACGLKMIDLVKKMPFTDGQFFQIK